MRRNALAPLLIALLALWLAPVAAAQGHPPEWTEPTEPFRIKGNVWYVGTRGLGAYLVTGSRGHVLVDAGMPENAAHVAASIRKLGFRPRDVRILLINHAHYDHAGGLAALKTMTGARLWASAGDKPSLEAGRTLGRPELDGFPPVRVDRVIRDGERLTLGDIRITALLTPGHTKGCTSWQTRAGGSAILFACSLTVAGQRLVSDRHYPRAAADFRGTFARLRKEKADIFLNFHPENFGMEAKRARQLAGDADAFVDAGELPRQVRSADAAFEKDYAEQRGVRAGR